ncbi:MAG TPA: cobalt ECF transporter T component CbiQ [Methanocellaceae archaeon]
MIPEWMKTASAEPCRCSSITTRKKSFIKKTLDDLFSFFEETIESEESAHRDGLLQSLDARVKLISILALIIAVSLLHDWRVLFIVYVLILVFAAASRIETWFFIKRVWLFIPIFAGIIVIPVIFNVFMAGDTLLNIATIGEGAHIGPIALPATIAITKQGAMTAIIFVLRVATCVSAAVLLFLTTPRDTLFSSLRSLGVPRVYVLTLNMSYRYIFLFIDMIKDFYVAKKSRTIKPMPLGEEQKWVGGRIGYTLVKSLDMGEKVHGAMLSRGYNGDVKLMTEYKMRPRDYTALILVLAFSAALVLISQNIIRI